MSWLPVNLGNLGDIAGAVNKLQEAAKSLGEGIDSALGIEATGEQGQVNGGPSHGPAPPEPAVEPGTTQNLEVQQATKSSPAPEDKKLPGATSSAKPAKVGSGKKKGSGVKKGKLAQRKESTGDKESATPKIQPDADKDRDVATPKTQPDADKDRDIVSDIVEGQPESDVHVAILDKSALNVPEHTEPSKEQDEHQSRPSDQLSADLSHHTPDLPVLDTGTQAGQEVGGKACSESDPGMERGMSNSGLTVAESSTAGVEVATTLGASGDASSTSAPSESLVSNGEVRARSSSDGRVEEAALPAASPENGEVVVETPEPSSETLEPGAAPGTGTSEPVPESARPELANGTGPLEGVADGREPAEVADSQEPGPALSPELGAGAGVVGVASSPVADGTASQALGGGDAAEGEEGSHEMAPPALGEVGATLPEEPGGSERAGLAAPSGVAVDGDGALSEAAELRARLAQLEVVLQSAARQSQSKADEIERLMAENDRYKAELEELKQKNSDAEVDALREEYQHRLGAVERKVYALTKERDMLRREQSRKGDASVSVLLKEKDEMIKQIMAEGSELSKKMAAQEGVVKALRKSVRELEEDKGRLSSRLQVEEARVESIKKDKALTEQELQAAVERQQAELAAQKEFYSAALAETKEALGRAEARGETDGEARAEVERRLRLAAEREALMEQQVAELQAGLQRSEREAEFRAARLQRDLEDMRARVADAEARHEDLVARMPDSTRPLLRQLEAMAESTSMQAEAMAGVERSLNARLLEAEAKAAVAAERERAATERLQQAHARLAVLEAQITMLRTEGSQLTRALDKERVRAAENRQEFLAAAESAAVHEGRARQLEAELAELRVRARKELADERARRDEVEARVRELQRSAAEQSPAPLPPPPSLRRQHSSFTMHGSPMDESLILQASIEGTGSHDPSPVASQSEGAHAHVPHSGGGGGRQSATGEHLEKLLRFKEGELAQYITRTMALESTRDSLAEELVAATTLTEQLRQQTAALPGLMAELEALRRRHTSALELMGERDEQVEELKADLSDVKQMYREQIDLLVNQIERFGAQVPTTAALG